MRYIIGAVSAIIIICLSINALSQVTNNTTGIQESPVPDNMSEVIYPGNSSVNSTNGTVLNSSAQAKPQPVPVESLADKYINDSITNYWTGKYESDDPLGAATPRESRRLNEEAHKKM